MALTTSITCCYVQSPSTSNSRNSYSLPPVSLIRYPIRRCPHHFAGAYSAAVRELGKTCLAAVQAYDNAAGSTEGFDAQLELIKFSSVDAARTNIGSSEGLDAAQLELQGIIDSPSVDEARKKIDDFAQRNQLKTKMVAEAIRAWLSPRKETNMTKDEVYEVMHHLYMVAASQRLKRKEIRILKYLLTIEGPEERMCALKDAFTPGPECKGEDVYFLYTTPKPLYDLIEKLVKAYTTSSKDSTPVKAVKDLMNPETIQKMEELKKVILDNFM